MKIFTIVAIVVTIIGVLMYFGGAAGWMLKLMCLYFTAYSVFGYLDTKEKGPNHIKIMSIIGIIFFLGVYIANMFVRGGGTKGLGMLVLIYAIVYLIIGFHWLNTTKKVD